MSPPASRRFRTPNLLRDSAHGEKTTTTNSALHRRVQTAFGLSRVDQALQTSTTQDTSGRAAKKFGYSTGSDTSRFYSYDENGRLSGFSDHVLGLRSCGFDAEKNWVCGYPQDQFVRADYYTYDLVGNRTDVGTTVQTGNRLMSFDGYTLSYDADGNLTQKAKAGVADLRYAWNSLGQLDSAYTGGVAVVKYGYDAIGRRVRKTTGSGVTTRYLWNGDQLLAELDASGAPIAEYSNYPGVDHPFSVTAGGVTYRIATDGPGSISGLIRSSDSTVVAKYRYSPFGAMERNDLTVAQSLRWQGLMYDAESGLYYVRARYYDPDLRRFASEDPIGLAGGVNLYTFSGNDPVNGRDPSGTMAVDSHGAICTIMLDTCGGGDDLDAWIHSTHGFGGAMGGASGPMIICRTDASTCAQLLGAARADGLQIGANLPVYVAPELYTAPTFTLDYTDPDDNLHVFNLNNASFKLQRIKKSTSSGVDAVYILLGFESYTSVHPTDILLWVYFVPVRSTLRQLAPGEYSGGFTQNGPVGGSMWGRHP